MNRSLSDRLNDIIDSVELARAHRGDLNPSALADAPEPRDAALFRIAVIGEAVSHLPTDVQALAIEIPWKDIIAMRNHIIHGYWQIDFRIVVETIELDLEPLKVAVRRLIAMSERDEI
jgi:uncharacterized protein with HEPN domain